MKKRDAALDHIDKALLNLLQEDFPLDREPFRVMASRLDTNEEGVLNRVRSMLDVGLVRSIGGFFDPVKLGYRSTLAALHVCNGQLDAAAEIVSRHPGVSHNYARNHRFNLWFTLSLPVEESADDVIADLSFQSGAETSLNLPAIRVFKLRVYFDMTGGSGVPKDEVRETAESISPGPARLSLEDKRVIRELCHELPVSHKPFDILAQRAVLKPDEFMARVKRLRRYGILRRFGAALRHRQAGYVANAMSCWSVPPERVEEFGTKAASLREVSHCYERRTSPEWSYNAFAMVHGHSWEECEQVVDALARDTGLMDYKMLYSTREYKKDRVKYFQSVA